LTPISQDSTCQNRTFIEGYKAKIKLKIIDRINHPSNVSFG